MAGSQEAPTPIPKGSNTRSKRHQHLVQWQPIETTKYEKESRNLSITKNTQEEVLRKITTGWQGLHGTDLDRPLIGRLFTPGRFVRKPSHFHVGVC